ncbi:hypothetical protein F5878DRAFT_702525 [Lentinula raphanica]|uniref:CxC2-like cysteine cluster KDZ transposase-associated domain-containing protein n=1 Tax=Lentinula raphanica TaxID=153919 RepID=A0AA38UI36_9AGAR|nr:hypothetical protein F5878DRAFT_702525 [Lentinula raphanica]
MAKKKKRPAVLDSSDIINSSEHHPMLILDTDTTHFQKQPFTSANTPRPPRAIITEHVEPRNEQHSHSSERAPESLDSEFIADTEKTRTQRAQLLAEYSENFTLVARLLMAKEADIRIGSVCVCNQAAHVHQPLHWAHVWSEAHGYFTRQDISTVLLEGYSIPLGHDGSPCPKASEPLLMTIVAVNGIHATQVSFCQCANNSRWRQLFDIDLFPATITQPQTAFTFELLRHWTVLNLQSKVTAHHYVAALRRQTDNVFTGNVPDISRQFRFITRIWPLFLAEKRSGYFYDQGMKEAFPLWPVDDLRTGCFVCPEDRVNMESGWERTPDHLRHIHSQRWVVDGNMKSGNFDKNNDPDDGSLFSGRAYMPSEQEFDHYQRTVPQLQKEKTTCNHLKVANGADTAKYKNQRISGNLHIQCDHGVVLSSVDITLGERLAIYDYALNLAINARPFAGSKRPDLVISYDNTCGAVANVHARWQKHFPDNSRIINNARFTIPACHVRNHVEGCDYLYCYQYKPNTGHFHGETVEATWAVFNPLGGAVLQMNPGHRIDTLIIHYSDWNWRKAVGASHQLQKDLDEAKIQYVSKRDHYAGLCDIFESRVLVWNSWDRSPKIDPKKKKTVLSVYSHNNEKAPTMKSLVDHLMSSEELVATSNGTVKAGSIAGWLKEGLAIVQFQSRVQRLAQTCKEKPTQQLRSNRTTLTTRIAKWRKLQAQYMPSTAPYLAQQVSKEVENKSLLLPSDFTASERLRHHLVGLATKQAQMLEIALGDLVQMLQTTVKTLSAAYERKHKHARGQDANTRANEGIRTIESKRNNLVSEYRLFRLQLQALDSLDTAKWPTLSIQDTYRKPTEKRRSPGDSRMMDGTLWRMSSAGRGNAQAEIASGLIFGNRAAEAVDEIRVEEPVFDSSSVKYRGTQMTSRQSRTSSNVPQDSTVEKDDTPNIPETVDVYPSATETKEGWIWHHGSLKNMSPFELEKWEDKSDSVQWFRAEADMERWQEQLEIKHAEFLRLITSFTKHRDAWDLLAKRYSTLPGHLAYAQEHRDLFDSLRVDAQERYQQSAVSFLLYRDSGETLADRIVRWRREEEKWFKWATRPPFNDPTLFKHGGDTRVPVSSGETDTVDLAGVKRKFDLV